jgi:hypothetical protein
VTDTPETDDFTYELLIMQRMIEQLPESVRKHFYEQMEKVVAAFEKRTTHLCRNISERVEDTLLHVKAMEHDLESTRRERDNLQKRLDGLS